MKFQLARLFPALLVVLWLLGKGTCCAYAADPPVYVILWFDTEDYILPQSDDAAKRLAEILTRLGVRATFKMVGEKARMLERRGRRDVIEALKKHEIGYHTNLHSQHPNVAEYLQNSGWTDGISEFLRREGPGLEDTRRIFGAMPACYGQPGNSWAPQAYPALRQMGVGAYVDEADHVGIDDQPFFYGGLLNIFKMRSTVARMDLSGAALERAGNRFLQIREKLQARGGGTVSIYYHPCEFVHAEFWDGLNFARGANPPRESWKLPALKPAAKIEAGFADFERYVAFIKAQKSVRFVTAAELNRLYEDASRTRAFTSGEIGAVARAVRDEVSFVRFGDFALSAADCFWLLTSAGSALVESGKTSDLVRLEMLDGPARGHVEYARAPGPSEVEWSTFARAISDVAAYCRFHRRVPEDVWLGAVSIAPQDYLATLAGAVETLVNRRDRPARISIRKVRFTADRYVAEDSPRLWGWVIFPEGFHAPEIMEMARLQAWTLKPAILRR